jgi:UDP-GlcNAc:undecaprenyl-phosphate/decaprenyl-phosphate GlcNAc-1-phosphate transferase
MLFSELTAYLIFNYRTYLGCFLLGAAVAWFVTPLVIRFSRKLGAIDHPANRKIHRREVPLLGGISIFVAMWCPLVFLIFYHNDVTARLHEQRVDLILIFISSILMLGVGILDDVRGLNAYQKLAVQLPLAIVFVIFGPNFNQVNLPFIGAVELGGFSRIISVLWIIGVTNALNLIDGIDGLATGVAFFVAITNAFIAITHGNAILAVVMCSMAGACLGFLRYNFNPARIFLGDTGSLFLGVTLAISSIVTNFKGTVASSMLIPLCVLGYPVIDTLLSMLRRLLRGKSMFSGDAGHIHHRLLQKGLGHRRAAVVLYGICLLFSLIAMAAVMKNNTAVAIGLFLLMVVLAAGFRFLGYSKYFVIQSVLQERTKYRIVFHYSQFIMGKLGLADEEVEVMTLLKTSAQELQLPRVELQFNGTSKRSSQTFDAVSPPCASGKTQTPSFNADHYSYPAIGLRASVYYDAQAEHDELLMEKRALFFEVLNAATKRLKEFDHNGEIESSKKHPAAA